MAARIELGNFLYFSNTGIGLSNSTQGTNECLRLSRLLVHKGLTTGPPQVQEILPKVYEQDS